MVNARQPKEGDMRTIRTNRRGQDTTSTASGGAALPPGVILGLCLVLVAVPMHAPAVVLEPGEALTTGGVLSLAGTVIYEEEVSFAIRDPNTDALLFDGVLQNRVLRLAATGKLAFLYRVRETKAGLDGSIGSVATGGFGGATTDVDFLTSSLGSAAPDLADRSADGFLVTFTFSDRAVLPGLESRFFLVSTDSEDFTAGGATTLITPSGANATVATVMPVSAPAPGCGDGQVTPALGEECDPPASGGGDELCDEDCRLIALPVSDAIERLELSSLSRPELRFEGGVARSVAAEVPLARLLGTDPVTRSLDFLERYAALWALEDPRRELYLDRITRDELGGRHLFFGQRRGPVPVFGARIAVHLEGDQVTGTGGNFVAEIPDLPPASLKAGQAEGIARASAGLQSASVRGVSRLFFYDPRLLGTGEPGMHLAWRVNLEGIESISGVSGSRLVLVDAHDGELLLATTTSPTHAAERDFSIKTADNNDVSRYTCAPPFEAADPAGDEWFDESGPTAGYPGAGADEYDDARNAFEFLHDTYDYFFRRFHRHG
jgi:hypothetical protein